MCCNEENVRRLQERIAKLTHSQEAKGIAVKQILHNLNTDLDTMIMSISSLSDLQNKWWSFPFRFQCLKSPNKNNCFRMAANKFKLNAVFSHLYSMRMELKLENWPN